MASMLRAASGALSSWQLLLERLYVVGQAHLPLARVVADKPFPVFWDSRPFVVSIGLNFIEAAKLNIDLADSTLLPFVGFKSPLSRLPRACCSSIRQTHAYKQVVGALYPDAWEPFLKNKLKATYAREQCDKRICDTSTLLHN